MAAFEPPLLLQPSGAEAPHFIVDGLRDAEAPLFHGTACFCEPLTACFHTFSAASELCPPAESSFPAASAHNHAGVANHHLAIS